MRKVADFERPPQQSPTPDQAVSNSHSHSHTPQIGEARHDLCRCRASLPLLGSSRRPSPKRNGSRFRGSHCPSWARTRTLLIQRGHCNSPNVRQLAGIYARSCHPMPGWTAFVSDFALLYSLKCRSLPESLPRDPFRAARLASRSPAVDECLRLACTCVTGNLFTIILLD